MNKWVMLGSAAAAGFGGAALAQDTMPSECRQELVELCRGAEGGLRSCVKTAFPKLSDPCRKAISDRSAARAKPLPAGMVEASYGSDDKQTLAFTRPAGTAKVPLLVFVHGGGWSIGDKMQGAAAKAEHFNALGWGFATLNYRLVPQATVEQQAADIASALAWLRAHAGQYRVDADRIVLMGHSAGAHLAALVASDPRFLAAAGVPLSAVDGVVLLDGAGYDISSQMARPGNPVGPMYAEAFGADPARQKALSPTFHAAAPNAESWLILPVASRADSTAQSEALAAALRKAGTPAMVVPQIGKTHATLNRELGTPGDSATAEVDRFLAAL